MATKSRKGKKKAGAPSVAGTRTGNSAARPGQNNSLRRLAEGLAERGVATLRYDKRGIGESAATAVREADLRFDTYVDDAAA
mgnify:CR=1 FL=1